LDTGRGFKIKTSNGSNGVGSRKRGQQKKDTRKRGQTPLAREKGEKGVEKKVEKKGQKKGSDTRKRGHRKRGQTPLQKKGSDTISR
jgi:hypothetical protein